MVASSRNLGSDCELSDNAFTILPWCLFLVLYCQVEFHRKTIVVV